MPGFEPRATYPVASLYADYAIPAEIEQDKLN